MAIGFSAMLVFGFFEQIPRRLPRWLPRWMIQVIAVAVSMPIVTFVIYVMSTETGAPPFWEVPDRMEGYAALTGLGVFLSPWIALGSLVWQKEALAREQALALDLARSEADRLALDARLNLLQAQVAPHFLFNTLANVQALVEAGSPKAPDVLKSLVAYLRAAVPRLNDPVTTLGQEVDLVRAYLELMRMRMPDRLVFELNVALYSGTALLVAASVWNGGRTRIAATASSMWSRMIQSGFAFAISSTKRSSSARPCTVCVTSGWNCTP